MLKMKKIDIAELERAAAGASRARRDGTHRWPRAQRISTKSGPPVSDET